MILSRQPKDGYVGAAGGRSIFRLANGSGRLQDGEEWTAKERNLLTRNHRTGAVAQPRNAFERRRRGAKVAVLLLQQVTQLLAMLGGKNRAGGHPAGGVGTGWVKRRKRFATVREIQKQPAESRQD